MSMISTSIDTKGDSHDQLIADFLGFGHTLCKQKQHIGEQLCQKVQSITQGSARLLLSILNVVDQQQAPFSVAVSFPVQFNNRHYGTLEIAPDAEYPASPALSLSLAQLLAHTCSLLLYSIESSVFIERQCQHLDYQAPEQLTRRERKVLELICQGYDQETIATMLDIMPATVETHRKRIRAKLGVHSERDIPLIAYQASLFSTLNECKDN